MIARSTRQGQGSATVLSGRPDKMDTSQLAKGLENIQAQFDEKLAKKALQKQKIDNQLEKALNTKGAFFNQTIAKKVNEGVDERVQAITSGELTPEEVPAAIRELEDYIANGMGIDKVFAQAFKNKENSVYFEKGEENGSFTDAYSYFSDQLTGTSDEYNDIDLEEYGTQALAKLAGGMEQVQELNPQALLNDVFGELVTKQGQGETQAIGQQGGRQLFELETTIPQEQLKANWKQKRSKSKMKELMIENNTSAITPQQLDAALEKEFSTLEIPNKRTQKDTAIPTNRGTGKDVFDINKVQVTTEREPSKVDGQEVGEVFVAKALPAYKEKVVVDIEGTTTKGTVENLVVRDGKRMVSVSVPAGKDNQDRPKFEIVELPYTDVRSSMENLDENEAIYKKLEAEKQTSKGLSKTQATELQKELEDLDNMSSGDKDAKAVIDKYLPNNNFKTIFDPDNSDDIEIQDANGNVLLSANTADKEGREKVAKFIKEQREKDTGIPAPAKKETPIETQVKPR